MTSFLVDREFPGLCHWIPQYNARKCSHIQFERHRTYFSNDEDITNKFKGRGGLIHENMHLFSLRRGLFFEYNNKTGLVGVSQKFFLTFSKSELR